MRKRVRLLVLIGLVLGSALLGGSAQAQPRVAPLPSPLTPEACVRAALARHPALRAARAEVAAAKAAHQEAQIARRPVLRATGSYRRLSANIPDFETALPAVSDDVVFEVPAIHNRYDLALELRQPLFSGFRRRSTARAAGHEALALRRTAQAAEADLALEVRKVYWALYEARAVRNATDEALRQVEALVRDARHREAAGMALRADVLALQVRHAEVRLAQVDAENAVRLARLQLSYLVGAPVEADVELADSLRIAPPQHGAEALVQQALRHRPEVAALEASLYAYAASTQAARGAWYPEIALVGTYLYARPNAYFFPLEDAFNGTWEAGVTATFDLWSWGRPGTQARQAEARRTRAKEELADLQARLRLDVERHVLAVERAVAAWTVAEEAVAAAEEAYRVTQMRFRQGAALVAEVLEAEVAYRQAEVRRAEVRAAYAVARASLEHATGLQTTGGGTG